MSRLGLTLLLLGALVVPHQLGAQEEGDRDPGRAFLLRAELEALGVRYRGYAESPVYSERLRARAREEADLIEGRLTDGDFEVGDPVLLLVEGEQALSDTFVVSRGQVLRLGEMGDVPLSGVLRAEFESRLIEYLGRFLREPEARTESYLRIAVDGSVVNPSFFRVPANTALADVIALAGGFAENANIENIRIERGGRRIWSGYPLQEAQSGGMTVDQMRLRDGDRIVVPRKRGITYETVRTLGLVLALPLSVGALLSVF